MFCTAKSLTLSDEDKDKQKTYVAAKPSGLHMSNQGKWLFGTVAGCYGVNSLIAVAYIIFNSPHVFPHR